MDDERDILTRLRERLSEQGIHGSIFVRAIEHKRMGFLWLVRVKRDGHPSLRFCVQEKAGRLSVLKISTADRKRAGRFRVRS